MASVAIENRYRTGFALRAKLTLVKSTNREGADMSRSLRVSGLCRSDARHRVISIGRAGS